MQFFLIYNSAPSATLGSGTSSISFVIRQVISSSDSTSSEINSKYLIIAVSSRLSSSNSVPFMLLIKQPLTQSSNVVNSLRRMVGNYSVILTIGEFVLSQLFT